MSCTRYVLPLALFHLYYFHYIHHALIVYLVYMPINIMLDHYVVGLWRWAPAMLETPVIPFSYFWYSRVLGPNAVQIPLARRKHKK